LFKKSFFPCFFVGFAVLVGLGFKLDFTKYGLLYQKVLMYIAMVVVIVFCNEKLKNFIVYCIKNT